MSDTMKTLPAPLAACHAAGTCDGYWHGQPGMHQQTASLH